jgi:hypothetical protein
MTDSPFFPVADQIRDAANHAQRATILLKLSDAALLGGSGDMEVACADAGFAAGTFFIIYRVAALCRTRDAHGVLPTDLAYEVEMWRQALSHIAAGTAPAVSTKITKPEQTNQP